MSKKLKLEDLKIGMRVESRQLTDIYDTYIILKDTFKNEKGNVEGTICYIGSELKDEASQWFVQGAHICSIYKEKEYFDGDVCYDE